MTKKAALKRKLELHRETVRTLNLREEAMVAGGVTVHSQCLTRCLTIDTCTPQSCTC
ncbi:MAG: hypothetical protein WAM82_19245 [Thermoanaerobaculia bacterium]